MHARMPPRACSIRCRCLLCLMPQLLCICAGVCAAVGTMQDHCYLPLDSCHCVNNNRDTCCSTWASCVHVLQMLMPCDWTRLLLAPLLPA
jgi:hypothetical protein